jgi:hypothetical protein
MKKINLVLVLFTVFGMSAFADESQVVKEVPVEKAQVRNQKFEKRIKQQQARIDQGLKKGKLTEEKADELKAEVKQIESERETLLKESNGKPLSKEQRKKIKADLKKSGQEIKDAKHSQATEEMVKAVKE